jgi:predicted ATPase with chaperone activity
MVKLEQAEARYDHAVAADVKYGALAEVDAAIKAATDAAPADAMLTEEVGPADIAAVVSRWTGIPVSKLEATEQQKLLTLKQVLHKRVVGQDAAVDAVADAVLRSRAGLASRARGSSFLFLGPTGVGKTELAKALAELLFDDEKNIVSASAWRSVRSACPGRPPTRFLPLPRSASTCRSTWRSTPCPASLARRRVSQEKKRQRERRGNASAARARGPLPTPSQSPSPLQATSGTTRAAS